MLVSIRLELGHSLKTESDTAVFRNTVLFGQIFSSCSYKVTFLYSQVWFIPAGYSHLHHSLVFAAVP